MYAHIHRSRARCTSYITAKAHYNNIITVRVHTRWHLHEIGGNDNIITPFSHSPGGVPRLCVFGISIAPQERVDFRA